jgi:hypothetical protein
MTPWYIDAIDPRAGLAVATQRESDLIHHGGLSESGASVFIAPPSFVPEFVGARSVGFALARNRGQAGLFHQEAEVHFDSLLAVAEFVRRVYVRGAGGDGTGENGGSSPPPSPEGGEPPGEPAEGMRGIEGGGETGTAGASDPIIALLTLASRNSLVAKRLTIGASNPGEALSEPLAMAHAGTDTRPRRLVRGALRVFREVIRCRPSRGSSPDELHWLMTLHRLVAILTRMGLWPLMLNEFHNKAAVSWVYGKNYSPAYELDYRLYQFLGGHGHWYWPDLYPVATLSAADAFDDLAILPVPPQTVPFAATDGQNLQALLSAATATPSQILDTSDTSLEEERAELAVFAAANLNFGSEYPPLVWGGDIGTCIQFADRLMVRAQTWFGTNVPRLVYATDVENLIGQASKIPA